MPLMLKVRIQKQQMNKDKMMKQQRKVVKIKPTHNKTIMMIMRR
tara:strand:- start:319 stop:450 length:132 start_codon:yes stop_codon:yes gene_type:complete